MAELWNNRFYCENEWKKDKIEKNKRFFENFSVKKKPKRWKKDLLWGAKIQDKLIEQINNDEKVLLYLPAINIF